MEKGHTENKIEQPIVGYVRAVRGQIVEIERDGSYIPHLRELLISPDIANVRLETYAYGEGRTLHCLLLSRQDRIRRNMAITATGADLTLPMGPAMLGRVMNLFGEPQDGGEDFTDMKRGSIYAIPSLSVEAQRSFGKDDIIETGIKAIDFFTPFLRGDRIGIVGGAGVGKTVLLTELLRATTGNSGGAAIFAGIGERIREGHELWHSLKSNGTLERTLLLIGQMNENAAIRFRIAAAAAAAAEYLRDEIKRDVMFFVDNIFRFAQAGSELSTLLEEIPSAFGYQATLESEMAQFEGRLASTSDASITSIQTVYVPADELGDPAVATALPHLDVVMVLSRSIAQQGLYPPIDFLRSRSGILSKEFVGQEHYETATQALEVLAHHERLARIVAIIGESELSAEDRGLFQRAEHIRAYMTQPLFATVAHSGRPGVSVPRMETVEDVRAILSGAFDTTPVEQLRYVGRIKTSERS
jgi:F-type H+-transporting ATPase subunit beta